MTPRTGRSERDQRRRELSQNLLRGTAVADRFLAMADPDPDVLCLEVGAGDGALTVGLAQRCERLLSYEIDPVFARTVSAKLRDMPGARVIEGDFTAARPPDEPFQVVGNAPFSITSAIVDWCLRARRMVATTLITQLEYARKRTGCYGRWSRLTVLTWPDVEWQLLGTIPRGDFRPVPRVDAGVLRLIRRPCPFAPPATLEAYQQIVELGFRGVGGSLGASLRRDYPSELVTAAFGKAGLAQDTVVAFVHPDQWWDLFSVLHGHRRTGRHRSDRPSPTRATPPARRR